MLFRSLTDSDMLSGYTTTPLTPIDEVYYALKCITDKTTGVQDTRKVWLQISFDAVQWKLKDGKVINRYPFSPFYDTIRERILAGATMNYSSLNQNPWLTFKDLTDGTSNVLWYEDSRSIQAKIKLAKMFGVQGLSLWRLGTIPNFTDTTPVKTYLDIFSQIQQATSK